VDEHDGGAHGDSLSVGTERMTPSRPEALARVRVSP
jgi:hypothetical protein